MPLPLLPLAFAGAVGAGALLLPLLKKTNPIIPVPTKPVPVNPPPGYQGIPQIDPNLPSRVPLEHGAFYYADLRSAETWDGKTDINAWAERVGAFVEKFAANNGLSWESSYWINGSTMRPGDPIRINLEFSNPGATGDFNLTAPVQSGIFMDTLVKAV